MLHGYSATPSGVLLSALLDDISLSSWKETTVGAPLCPASSISCRSQLVTSSKAAHSFTAAFWFQDAMGFTKFYGFVGLSRVACTGRNHVHQPPMPRVSHHPHMFFADQAASPAQQQIHGVLSSDFWVLQPLSSPGTHQSLQSNPIRLILRVWIQSLRAFASCEERRRDSRRELRFVLHTGLPRWHTLPEASRSHKHCLKLPAGPLDRIIWRVFGKLVNLPQGRKQSQPADKQGAGIASHHLEELPPRCLPQFSCSAWYFNDLQTWAQCVRCIAMYLTKLALLRISHPPASSTSLQHELF